MPCATSSTTSLAVGHASPGLRSRSEGRCSPRPPVLSPRNRKLRAPRLSSWRGTERPTNRPTRPSARPVSASQFLPTRPAGRGQQNGAAPGLGRLSAEARPIRRTPDAVPDGHGLRFIYAGAHVFENRSPTGFSVRPAGHTSSSVYVEK
jgi:hypothetical protein